MNDEQNTMPDAPEAEAQASAEQQPPAVPKKRGPGRPRKSETGTTTPRRRGRPPKSATGARRGRPPKAMSLVMEFEREIEARFQAKLDKSEAQIAALKAELKAMQKRERTALRLFEKQEKALTKFVTTWNAKELAKVQKAAEPKKRRGRPRKTV